LASFGAEYTMDFITLHLSEPPPPYLEIDNFTPPIKVRSLGLLLYVGCTRAYIMHASLYTLRDILHLGLQATFSLLLLTLAINTLDVCIKQPIECINWIEVLL
jgi:hypothetical protein